MMIVNPLVGYLLLGTPPGKKNPQFAARIKVYRETVTLRGLRVTMNFENQTEGSKSQKPRIKLIIVFTI